MLCNFLCYLNTTSLMITANGPKHVGVPKLGIMNKQSCVVRWTLIKF